MESDRGHEQRLTGYACIGSRILLLMLELNAMVSHPAGTRLPGREWKVTRAPAIDVATLAGLLCETEEHHGHYEKTHVEHNWWDWYAPYLSARQNGSSPEEAAAAGRYMEEALHFPPG